MKHTKKMVILILCATLIAFGLAVYFKNPEFYEMFAIKVTKTPPTVKPKETCEEKCKSNKEIQQPIINAEQAVANAKSKTEKANASRALASAQGRMYGCTKRCPK